MNKIIPVSTPLLDGRETEYLSECIRDGWISSEGPFVRRLEKEFAAFHGLELPGAAVSSGTAALETALYALGVGEGDEVIIPDFTIISCALACLRLGAVPVPVDCDAEHFLIDPALIEKAITPKTKVIMAVHIYGAPADMEAISALGEKYHVAVLEDCAEAIGSRLGGQLCGTFGDAAAFSFYANKLITTGEGGMVLSKHEKVMERARAYRNLCFGSRERFLHEDTGYNFRMTNLQAAVGCAQLERIGGFIEIKRRNGERCREGLRGLPGLRFLDFPSGTEGVYWMYCVVLDRPETNAAELMERLKKHGIMCRPFFRGMHDQPALRGKIRLSGSYPRAEAAYRNGFYLPSGTTLTGEEIDHIVSCVRKELEA